MTLTLYAVEHTAHGRTTPDPIQHVHLTEREALNESALILTLGRKRIVQMTVDGTWQPVTS